MFSAIYWYPLFSINCALACTCEAVGWGFIPLLWLERLQVGDGSRQSGFAYVVGFWVCARPDSACRKYYCAHVQPQFVLPRNRDQTYVCTHRVRAWLREGKYAVPTHNRPAVDRSICILCKTRWLDCALSPDTGDPFKTALHRLPRYNKNRNHPAFFI